MEKKYISDIVSRSPRPRSRRLREQGIGGSLRGNVTVASGGSGDYHVHANKTTLDRISADDDGYLYISSILEQDGDVESKTEKILAGYADKAGKANLADLAYDLTDDSPTGRLIRGFSSNFIPMVKNGNDLMESTWAAISDGAPLFAVKSVKGLYTPEFLSARGDNPDLSPVPAGLQWADIEPLLSANGYAKKSDFPSLAPYALKSEIPSLSGFASEQWVRQWVGNQGFLNSASWIDLDDKPTTIDGFGISDAYSMAQIDSMLARYLYLDDDNYANIDVNGFSYGGFNFKAAGALCAVIDYSSIDRRLSLTNFGGPVSIDAKSGEEVFINGAKAWHAANDGPGSGLDADTLDGTHLSAINSSISAKVSKSGDTMTGSLTAPTLKATSILGTDNDGSQLDINAQAYINHSEFSPYSASSLRLGRADARWTDVFAVRADFSSSIKIGGCTISWDGTGLHFSSGIASDGFVSARGSNSAGGASSAFNRLDSWAAYSDSTKYYALSALLGFGLKSDIASLASRVAYLEGLDFSLDGHTHSEYAPAVHSHSQYALASSLANYYTKTETDSKYLLSSSYTASDILTKLKTVDGASSGLDADLLDGLESSDFTRLYAGDMWSNDETVADWSKRIKSQPGILSRKDWAWANSANLTLGSYSIDRQRYSAIDFRSGNLNSNWQQKAYLFLPTYSDTSMIYIAQMTTSATAGEVTTSVKRYADYDTIIGGNVASASKLANTRTIWGQNFNGEGNVSGAMTSVGSISFLADGTYNIGSASSQAKWIYANGIYAKAGSWLGLGANNADHMRILTNGNVGIGTTAPAYKLDVNGIIKTNSRFLSTFASSSWLNGVTNAVLTANYSGYGAILCAPTKDGRISLSTYPGNDNTVYLGYIPDGHTANALAKSLQWQADTGKLTTEALAANKLTIGSCEITYENGALHFSKGIYSVSFISARGANAGGGGSGGGLIQNVYGWNDLGGTFSNNTLTDTFNAYTINKLATDKADKTWVEGKGYLTATNAAATYQPKGTYLTAHQSLANYMKFEVMASYVNASFNDSNLSQKAHDTYIELWDGPGWWNLKAGKFMVPGGTSSQFLKADGSVDSTAYLASSSYTASDILTKIKTVDGSGSGLDADLLDGKHDGEVTAKLLTTYEDHRNSDSLVTNPSALTKGVIVQFRNATGAASGVVWNTIVSLNAYSGGSSSGAGYRHQFLFSDSTNEAHFWVRNGIDSTWNGWNKVAFLSDNVASATKLADNSAFKAWGQTFFTNGKPHSISGNLFNVGDIYFNGGNFPWTIFTNADHFYFQSSCNDEDNEYLYIDGKNGKVSVSKFLGVNCVPAYALDVLGDQRLSSSISKAGGDVSLELWRGTNASWRFLNSSGTLKLQSNYTDKVGSYFDCLTLAYNSGNARFKGSLTTPQYYTRDSYTGAAWNAGYGAYNVAIANNSAQTPLFVAYRAGKTPSATGADRLFALEFLNSGASLAFAFAGASKATLSSDGAFWLNGTVSATAGFYTPATVHAVAGVYSEGYISARGQNSSSDARLKSDFAPFDIDLHVIAHAPSVSFRWMSDGAKDLGSIAQYWQRVNPILTPKDPDGFLTLQYGKTALLASISIARDLVGVKSKTENHEQRIRRLEQSRNDLKRENKKLRRIIAILKERR